MTRYQALVLALLHQTLVYSVIDRGGFVTEEATDRFNRFAQALTDTDLLEEAIKILERKPL